MHVAAYLERIACQGPHRATPDTLEALHRAHLAAIPFENLDVRLGRPIRLDLDSLEAKLVEGRRGGYCFEQNTLFAAALRALGFDVDTLEARVRRGSGSLLPRTHMVLRVRVGGRDWLADVGFGADGPLVPVPLDGSPSEQPGVTYRVVPEGDVLVLQSGRDGVFTDQYAFGLHPAHPVDYEVANHFTSTHPSSPFVQTATVQRVTAEARHALRGLTHTARRGQHDDVHEVPAGEIPALLRGVFGLDLPPADVLRAFSSFAAEPQHRI